MVSDARTYPRRLDTAETVTAALLLGADGLGYRQIAARVDRPATTVRDWLRRARRNCEAVRVDATVGYHRLDANSTAMAPTGTQLGDMLDAVGAATAAWVRRFAAATSPWQLTVILTRGAILAPRPQPRWHPYV